MSARLDASASLLGRSLRIGSLLVASAGTLLFLALFLLSSRDLARQEEAFASAAPGEAWLVHELATRLHRLQHGLFAIRDPASAAALEGDAGNVPGEALSRQLDDLLRQVDLLDAGPEVAALAALPQTRQVQDLLRQSLGQFDTLLPDIQRGDAAALAEGEAILERLAGPLQDYAQLVLHRGPVDLRSLLQAQSDRIELYLAAMLLLGLALILSLAVEIRRGSRLARRARRAHQLAADESAAKSVFLATVSHEIRTPLNAISGFAELIERQPFGPVGNEKYLEYAHDIIASTAHLRALLDDVTDAQLVLQGEISLEDEEIELRPFMAETLRIVRANCAGRYLPPRVETDIPPVVLRADRRRVRQVLINLMVNAIRYSDGQAEIRIDVVLKEAGLEIDVSDKGRGIAPDDLDRVFHPFQRGRQASGRAAPGMGLGLTIVRSIMGAHGGSVRMSSILGQGTRVTIAFPARRLVRDRSQSTSRMQSVAAE
ncbi:MAG: HAMP domain-containing sensor histidine kinase [Sneathiellaceae bacterium]